MKALVVEGPARESPVAKSNVDPFRICRHDRRELPRRTHQLGRRSLPIARVEAYDEIRVAKRFLGIADVERVAAWKVQAAIHVVHGDASRLGELHERMKSLGLAADVLRDDDRPFG